MLRWWTHCWKPSIWAGNLVETLVTCWMLFWEESTAWITVDYWHILTHTPYIATVPRMPAPSLMLASANSMSQLFVMRPGKTSDTMTVQGYMKANDRFRFSGACIFLTPPQEIETQQNRCWEFPAFTWGTAYWIFCCAKTQCTIEAQPKCILPKIGARKRSRFCGVYNRRNIKGTKGWLPKCTKGMQRDDIGHFFLYEIYESSQAKKGTISEFFHDTNHHHHHHQSSSSSYTQGIDSS